MTTRKKFEVGEEVDVIRDTEYGRPWETARYIAERKENGRPYGWHYVQVGVDRVQVPTRRIRKQKCGMTSASNKT